MTGIAKGVEAAMALGIRRLKINSDSLLAIKILLRSQTSTRRTAHLAKEIISKLNCLEEKHLQHSFRQMNKAAYFLANLVIEIEQSISCSDCQGGFIEQINNPPLPSSRSPNQPRQFPAAAMFMLGTHPISDLNTSRRNRSGGGDRSSFNPVIVLRGGPSDSGGEGMGERGSYELYYDDGAGSGIQPLPASMSDFLMGSGFDRLLDQLSRIGIDGVGQFEQQYPPASKAAIDQLPTIVIASSHVRDESHCAVCTDEFELGTVAREMPCKHIYHPHCILPWLSMKNSCPVCRHELPVAEGHGSRSSSVSDGSHDEQVPLATPAVGAFGLTIWRLPGGGFAVGRFSAGGLTAGRENPGVYTEMDGDFSNGGGQRMLSWESRSGRTRESGGVGGFFRSFLSFFRRNRSSSSRSIFESRTSHSHSNNVLSRASRVTNRAWRR
ncbi:E3 ubiquitin-protein ligase rduf1 [Thalictrum thalictroides]|uniref:RING-type E3 ubiquitin transferase n=1 Tax=Thalictrum thalictroides TaxID=46969 RepID=A0A7J6X7F1_THATH|nr:E3 ubiquitin-protein ligase rduf1 [Thalictrum thalictroides]